MADPHDKKWQQTGCGGNKNGSLCFPGSFWILVLSWMDRRWEGKEVLMLYICVAGKTPQLRIKKRPLSFLKEMKAFSPTAIKTMEEWHRLLLVPSHFNIVCEPALRPQKKQTRMAPIRQTP